MMNIKSKYYYYKKPADGRIGYLCSEDLTTI